jgi:hypothetical protein
MMTSGRQWIVWIAAALTGCSASHTTSQSSAGENAVSAVTFDLSIAAGLDGHSIRICGLRANTAGPSDVCDAELPASTSSVTLAPPEGWTGGHCPCFKFGANGGLVDPTTNDPNGAANLCPSGADEYKWTFSYTLYADDACAGAVLNPAGGDLVCYDSNDLLTQASPNATVEALQTGLNSNTIICLSRPSSKEWDILSCSIATTSADTAANRARYSCGCADSGTGCECGTGLAPGDLETGCTFEAGTCDIVCGSVTVVAPPPASPPPSEPDAGTGTCPSEIFASLRSGLASFDPSSCTFSPLAGTDGHTFDALAFNPKDGALYALSRLPSGSIAAPAVVRVGRDGRVTPLGAIPQLAGTEWSAGTFSRDGTYVLGGQTAWAKLRLGQGNAPELLDTGSITVADGAPSSWAASPTDGLIYGYLAQQGRLVVFDPSTNTLTVTMAVPTIGAQSCTSAFRSSGELLLYCNGSGSPGSGSLYSVNVWDCSATLLMSSLTADVRGLASCAFQ